MEQKFIFKIDNIFKAFNPISPATLSIVIESGVLNEYKKGEAIFSEKKFNAFEYFLLEGIAHRYNMDESNQITTTGIYVGPSVITPHFARTLQSSNIFSLQALTDCTLFTIPIGSFDTLRMRNEQLRAFGQRVVETEFRRSLNYEVLFRSCSAIDRLLFFRQYFPLLENLIPHTVIASFLGITPVSFSRLRNELSKK